MDKNIKEKFSDLKEDYNYLLKMIKQKNEEINNLELLVSNLLDKIHKLENKTK